MALCRAGERGGGERPRRSRGPLGHGDLAVCHYPDHARANERVRAAGELHRVLGFRIWKRAPPRGDSDSPPSPSLIILAVPDSWRQPAVVPAHRRDGGQHCIRPSLVVEIVRSSRPSPPALPTKRLEGVGQPNVFMVGERNRNLRETGNGFLLRALPLRAFRSRSGTSRHPSSCTICPGPAT